VASKAKAVESVSTATFDLDCILSDVRDLYSKDARSQQMVSRGDTLTKAYTPEDGLPLPDDHPLKLMTNLPCIPFNKIAQWSGEEDTGKSTMLLTLLAAAQKLGWIVVVWDAEDKFDGNRFCDMGGDPERIILVKTNEILQGGEKLRKIISTALTKYPQAKLLGVWDSVGGSQSRSHAERELDSEKHAQPGQDAKENGSVMKMLVSLFNKYPDRIVILLANQVYSKIGFMQHGNKESGGKKVAYHSSLIIQLKRIKVLTKVMNKIKVKYGIITRATMQKNHLSQGKTSVHQMDFEITADGARVTDSVSDSDTEDSE
jgi:RecA/RadA recombinase